MDLCVYLLQCFFYACSNEEISMKGDVHGNKSLKVESEKNSLSGKTDFIQENLNSFSEQVVGNIGSLETALNKNSYVGFNAQAMQMLSIATEENDLKIIFEMAGIANSQEVIDILKKNVALQQAFILENPNFYNLTLEEQTELLNGSFELAINNYNTNDPLPPSGLVGDPNCARIFNKSIDRCNGDFGTCAVFAVAGAYAGLAPGLLAAAYCMVSKVNCDGRAKEDYKECVSEPVSPDGPPPVTGELSIVCSEIVLDSCWLVDSNGKYVRPFH